MSTNRIRPLGHCKGEDTQTVVVSHIEITGMRGLFKSSRKTNDRDRTDDDRSKLRSVTSLEETIGSQTSV